MISQSRVLNPSLHNAQGDAWWRNNSTYEYIINKLNDYGLAYIHLTEPFTDVSEVPLQLTQVAKHFRPFYKGTLIINKRFQ
jgi:N-ethylmaleimide reductase